MRKYLALFLVSFHAFGSIDGSISFDKSRLIMNSNKENLQITNNKQHPLLIKASVYTEQYEKSNDFIATPPILKSESMDRNIIKIIRKNTNLPTNKEYLNWLCIDAIPPQEMAHITRREKRSDAINITIRGCIKIINRPEELPTPSFSKLSEQLNWSLNKNTLTIKNNSPYYINFSDISIDNVTNNNIVYLKPYSEDKINLPQPPKSISWSLIDDFGSQTKTSKHIF